MSEVKKNGEPLEDSQATVHKKEKHPPGLYLLFFTEMWERFSYYGMRGILTLYLTTAFISGGLGFDASSAAMIYGCFTGFVYFTPLIGGYLSDNYLGQRKAILIGGVTMAIGQFTLFSSQSRTALYIGLLLLILGNGFFKPNISNLVGQLYTKNDPRKDSAFTIFYMGINIGSFFAPLICGTLAENWMAVKEGGQVISYGYRYGFLAAAIGMIIGQLLFNALAQKYLGDIGKYPATKDKTGHVVENKPLTKKEKQRVTVIFILTAFCVFFWAAFEQAGTSLTIYTKDFINRNVGGFEIPVSWFQSLNPFFVVTLGPVFAALWVKLSKREKGDLTVPQKMGMALVLVAVGFLCMVGAVLQRGGAEDMTVKASVIWLIFTYFFHTVAELSLSPVGLSMVSKLSPPKLTSLLMGVWLSASFIANLVGGVIASKLDSFGHMQIFGGIAAVTFLLGLILLTVNKKLVKMME
ncbi:proton-dependent oligopeptide transporter, POT family [Clostridium cavendishii DSM 21758]|uniref:Proton-dependent oligopeptide transporter, POT family n=1 Tax=Clostridium cavendishii DSM 21758 TaxID=1121302 RepID=A0A1M6ANZ4_9CLOT|nr:peptide MFS transporter [Clostridium cavendishii]SHI37923.1 proton-dependent oligopeptide transporter, POT family [Clostridium cavendishii DSM 21758]